ncbi:MAG: catalase [Ruminococcaceae bacterium]|nr:catalase [Oscillospiraceae bacterium]
MNAIKHFITITKHRHKVFSHAVKAGIPFRGLIHDLSKYSPTEFITGIKYYKGTRSPNDGERAAYGYSKAWMHHKGRNKHHFEYWTDYEPGTKKLRPVKMPVKFLKEMFCDRVAASKIYNKDKYTDGDSYDYYMRGKDQRYIHPETAAMLEKLLLMLKEEGEEKTFRYLKSLKEY